MDSVTHFTTLATTMQTYPATPEEYQEYCSVMNAMVDEAEANTPDPTPEDMGFYEVSEEEEAYWAARADQYDAEDRYLDSSWEDRAEMGMGY